jgi:NNP family nitrate/nitrite transporter-like MFS transporter
MIPYVISAQFVRPAIGWISAMAAYGGFIIPTVFAITIKIAACEATMYGLAAYYVICLVVLWFAYLRKAECNA